MARQLYTAALLVIALSAVSLAQIDYCSRYGGVCSYSQCSRYFVSSSEVPLCPSSYQRCCMSELCMTKFGGICQSSYLTCNGAKYTHYGTQPMCSRSGDACCISGPTQTTPPPVVNPPVQKDECGSIGGTCQAQTRTCNGRYRLVGDNSEILCNNWYLSNERCCVPNSVAPVTSAPVRPTPAGNTQATCGVQKVKLLNKRIIGGNTAEKGEWPWQVSIIKSSSYLGRSFQHTCGGTLIHPQWVLSAAHCFTDVTSHYTIRVRVGEHSFYVEEGTESDGKVANIINHPQYIHSENKNDIALIKLTQPVDLNSQYIGLACMPEVADMNDFYKTSECFSTGWGNTRGTGDGDSNILQEVQSSLVNPSTCYSKWGYKIDDTKVCFGNGMKGACVGDSGGPLVCKKNNHFFLVGVVSYGSKSCTDIYVPTVYTKVAAYKSWIDSVIASN